METSQAVCPFVSSDRVHFPQWSPMFSKGTPVSVEKNHHYWSIDQLAKLKPADIATSPDSLAVSNLSPPDDPHAQIASDKFFSQKSIFPSPWSMSSKIKRVTFSPLPPTTSYYTKEDSFKVDAGTQTNLTIPLDMDLENLLGKEFHDTSFTLRRKLFGQPERSTSFNEESHLDYEKFDNTHLSSTPLRSSSSPAVIITKVSEDSLTRCSSFVNELNESELMLSPIVSCSDRGSLPTNPDNVIKSNSTPNHSIPKRQLQVSPQHIPQLKQPCVNSTHSDEATPPISLTDLQSEADVNYTGHHVPSTCTTYFNNLLLDDTVDKQVQSLALSWQPQIHSTMLEGNRRVGPHNPHPSFNAHCDSGMVSGQARSLLTTSHHLPSCEEEELCDSGFTQPIITTTPPNTPKTTSDKVRMTTPTSRVSDGHFSHSLLPSRLKLTHTPTDHSLSTPISRYTLNDVAFSHDLVRRKNYFKAKLNFTSPVNRIPLRMIPLQDKT